MFDYHLHSHVSHDSKATPESMVQAALQAGLREICFTDHLDFLRNAPRDTQAFRVEAYNKAYDHLSVPGLHIRRGAEVSLAKWSIPMVEQALQQRPYDFIIGSLHFLRDRDIYVDDAFWAEHPQQEVIQEYFEEVLEYIQDYDNFDVLGHLTYISKCPSNPNRCAIEYRDHREIVDEIFKVLISKGKGLEINTSAVDSLGVFLPEAEYLRRFKELGGEIITVGSDAHQAHRVGQHINKACALVGEIFGHVCTFENRKPVFHKL